MLHSKLRRIKKKSSWDFDERQSDPNHVPERQSSLDSDDVPERQPDPDYVLERQSSPDLKHVPERQFSPDSEESQSSPVPEGIPERQSFPDPDYIHAKPVIFRSQFYDKLYTSRSKFFSTYFSNKDTTNKRLRSRKIYSTCTNLLVLKDKLSWDL